MGNEILIQRMRDIRDTREKEIFYENKTDEFSKKSVEEIRYIGKMEFRQTIEGKEELVKKDVFILLENNDGEYIYKYYNEDMQLLGVERNLDNMCFLSSGMMERTDLTDIQKKNILQKLSHSSKNGKTLEDLEKESSENQNTFESKELEQKGVITGALSKSQVDRMSGPQTLLSQEINGRTLGNTINLTGKYLKMVDADTLRRELPDIEIPASSRNVPVEVYEDGSAKVIGEDKLKLSHLEGKHSMKEQVTVRNDGTVAEEQNIEVFDIVASGGKHTISVGYDEQFRAQQQHEIKFGERDITNPTRIAYTELKSTYEYKEQDDGTWQYKKETGLYKGEKTIERAQGDKECLQDEKMSVENVDSNPNNNIVHDEDVFRYANAMAIYKDGTRLPDLEKARKELEYIVSTNPDKTVDEIIKEMEKEEKTLGPNQGII